MTKVSAQTLNGPFNKGLHRHSLVYLHKLRIWVMNFANVPIIKTIIYFHKSNMERLNGLAGTTLCNLNGFLVFHYKIITWKHNLCSFSLFFSWHFILLELTLKVRVFKVWIFCFTPMFLWYLLILIKDVQLKATCVLDVEMARNWNPHYSIQYSAIYMLISLIIQKENFLSTAIILCENHWNGDWLTFSHTLILEP